MMNVYRCYSVIKVKLNLLPFISSPQGETGEAGNPGPPGEPGSVVSICLCLRVVEFDFMSVYQMCLTCM